MNERETTVWVFIIGAAMIALNLAWPHDTVSGKTHLSRRAAECRHPRGPRRLRDHKGPSVDRDLSEEECKNSVAWGDAADPSQPYQIATGQNLEDAVVAERFFRRGPLKSKLYGGFFFEMGALDGITFSNTLAFEHCLGWEGILVEAHPVNARACRKNRPCATVYETAACSPPLQTLQMSRSGNGVARIHGKEEGVDASKVISVPCEPLSKLFAEYGVSHIDFFSLDVEGAELDTLKTINWDVVTVDVLIVETTGSMTWSTETAKILHNDSNPKTAEVRRKAEDIRAYLEGVAGMTRVPAVVNRTDVLPSGRTVRPSFLSIAGSDVYIRRKDVVAYDERLWRTL